jgi:pentatricopeptide repeat protein
LLGEMQSANLTPGEDVHTSIIGCCCRLKMPTEALTFLDSMIKSGYLPRIESYRHIICSLCEEGSIKTAKKVLGDMLLEEYNYDEIVWKILIDGLLRKGNAAECSILLSVMEEQDYRPGDALYAKLTGKVTIANDAHGVAQ